MHRAIKKFILQLFVLYVGMYHVCVCISVGTYKQYNYFKKFIDSQLLGWFKILNWIQLNTKQFLLAI